jgi:hypothetical protein
MTRNNALRLAARFFALVTWCAMPIKASDIALPMMALSKHDPYQVFGIGSLSVVVEFATLIVIGLAAQRVFLTLWGDPVAETRERYIGKLSFQKKIAC